ncbi:MAG: LysR family transcriptional regulator [Chloroflexi bacterium]|nr:LysR family transcriptional regulator [Chloroflexota bacterium]
MDGLAGRVTVHQLRLLTAVADNDGFTRAADALGLSQPAISHQLKSLSDALGLPLIEIIGRRVRLTQAGRLLYDHGKTILAAFDAAGSALDELRGLRSGSLTLAGDTTVGIYVLPDLLGGFRREHPGTQVRLDVGNRKHLYDRLMANDVDFAVTGRLWEDPPVPLVVRPFLPNELIAIAARGHRLARASSVTLAQLLREPFIGREIGSGTRETVEEAVREAGLSLRPFMELASNGAIKRAVAQELGVSVLSRYAAGLELTLGHVVELPVSGFPLRRRWHLVHARDKRMGPLDEAFLRFVQEGDWRASIGRPLSTD